VFVTAFEEKFSSLNGKIFSEKKIFFFVVTLVKIFSICIKVGTTSALHIE
jgi:hypothetical protein